MRTKLLLLIAAVVLSVTCVKTEEPEMKELSDVFSNPYAIKIIDEHEVQCVSESGETVVLYFENAYRLSDEWCVYIKK